MDNMLPDRTSDLIDAISTQFDKSFLTIILFCSLFIVFLLVLFLVNRMQKSAALHRRKQQGEKVFREIIKKKSLTPDEQDLLVSLAKLEKKVLPYELCLNNALFNRCVRKGEGRGIVSLRIVPSLRIKLGFNQRKEEGIPHSSVELGKGTGVILSCKGKSAPGTVAEITPEGLQIASPLSRILSAGNQVTVLFHRTSGEYSFQVPVVSVRGEILSVSHSEKILVSQKRSHYRKKIKMSLGVRSLGSTQKFLHAVTLDLGGGGVSFFTDDKQFRPGQILEFSLNLGGIIRITGRVLRISRKGSLVHAQFEHLNEKERDMIIKCLFT